MAVIKFPFTSFQQFNLDWIMEQLHKILQFMPMNGAAGDVLQRNADGAAWMPIAAISMDIHSMDALLDPVAGNDELPIYDNSAQGNFKATVSDLMLQAPVQSVNGQTGDVVLSIPSVPVTSVNGQTGDVVLSIPSDTSDLVNDSGFVDAAGAAAAAPVQSVAGKTGTVTLVKGDVGLGNVDNVQQYSASNPPPYPVTSVNGMTGDVIVSGGGGFNLDVLWTNSSPTSSFSAQTIPLDLTGYSAIVIECALTTNAAQPVTCPIFPINITRDGRICCYNNSFLYRDITISGSGVTFASGKQVSTYMATPDDANAAIIPLRILGIA